MPEWKGFTFFHRDRREPPQFATEIYLVDPFSRKQGVPLYRAITWFSFYDYRLAEGKTVYSRLDLYVRSNLTHFEAILPYLKNSPGLPESYRQMLLSAWPRLAILNSAPYVHLIQYQYFHTRADGTRARHANREQASARTRRLALKEALKRIHENDKTGYELDALMRLHQKFYVNALDTPAISEMVIEVTPGKTT